MSGNWTPGPWVAVRNTAYWEINPVNDAGDGCVPYSIGDVCASNPGDDSGLQRYNAHLIAAAPDLYEALDAMLQHCDVFTDSPAHNAARTALAKARGEA